MFGRQPVVDGHHDGAGAHGMLAGRTVVGVQVTDDEPAAVKVQHDGLCCVIAGIGWRPVDPDIDGARRPLDDPVLDPQFGVQRPAGQVCEPLPRRVDPVVH